MLYSAPLNYLQLTPFHLGRTGHPSLMGSALCGQRWWGGEHPKAEKDMTVPTKEQPGEYAGQRREHWTEGPGLTFSSALEPQPGSSSPESIPTTQGSDVQLSSVQELLAMDKTRP